MGGTSMVSRSNGFSRLDTPMPPDNVRSLVRPLSPGGLISTTRDASRAPPCVTGFGDSVVVRISSRWSVGDVGERDERPSVDAIEKRVTCLDACRARFVGNLLVQGEQPVPLH